MLTGTLTGRVTDLTDAALDDRPVLVANADRIVVDGDAVRLPDPVRKPFDPDGTVTLDLAATDGWLWRITLDVPGRHMPTWVAAILPDTVTKLADLVLLNAQPAAADPVKVLDHESAAAAQEALALMQGLPEHTTAPTPSSLVERTAAGTVKVAAPVADDDAVPLRELVDVAAHVVARTATLAPSVVTLLSGQVDETYTGTNSTRTVDTVNHKVGGRALKVTMAGAVTATVILDPPGPTDPLIMPPAAAVGMWVYVPNPALVTSISVELYTTADLATAGRWARPVQQANLVAGWNCVRWAASEGLADLSTWGTVYRVRLVVATTGATDVTVGHVWAECPPRAQVLFIEDRGYKTFVTSGALAQLRALGIPVTWALDPALLGTSVGTKNEVVTENDIAAAARAGDSISLHGWDGAATAAMTADEAATDTLRGLRWLQQRGYPGRMWRAAWVQNQAAQAAAAQPYVLAYATPTNGSAPTAWPFINRWNVPRWALHGRSAATVDAMFAGLARTHGLLVCYTHGVHADGGFDTTPAEWAYFVSKLTAAVAAGWLEGVTFEDLYGRSGGTFRSVFGQAQAEYLDAAGTLVRRDLL